MRSLAASAQQPRQRVRRIGVLLTNAEDDSEAQHRIKALNQGLEIWGWAPGTVRIDYRFAVVDAERTRNSRVLFWVHSIVAARKVRIDRRIYVPRWRTVLPL